MSDITKAMGYQPIITGRPEKAQPAVQKPAAAPGNPSFGELLQKTIAQNQTQTLTFSKHAQARTQQRGITLSEDDLGRISEAVGKAGDKGVTDTLVLMGGTAFIVNVPSRVVVTVVDKNDTQSVFTNIDGAVLVE